MYDAIVVGLGPAGAVTAAELARAGLSVLGLEWKAVPRYKVCGGGLSARIDRLLEPDFHPLIEDTIHAVRFRFAGTESFEVVSREPIAFMVMRDRFDAHLVRKAEARGVRILDNERVVSVSEGADGVAVTTARGWYRARIVVGADGANSVVARSLFAGRRGRLWGALEGEVVVPRIPSSLGAGAIALDIGVVPWGYAWVFPKEGRLSVGVAGLHGRERNPKGCYDRFVQGEPILTGIEVPRGLGHPIPLYGGRPAERMPLATKRAVLVGDAAHLVDPVLGEGIYYAILSGRMAAVSIVDHLHGLTPDLTAYDAEVAREIYPEFRVAARMAWAVYTFPRIMHQALRRGPEVVRLYYDVLKGRETYQSFFAKIRGKAEAFFARLVREKAASVFSRGCSGRSR